MEYKPKTYTLYNCIILIKGEQFIIYMYMYMYINSVDINNIYCVR